MLVFGCKIVGINLDTFRNKTDIMLIPGLQNVRLHLGLLYGGEK